MPISAAACLLLHNDLKELRIKCTGLCTCEGICMVSYLLMFLRHSGLKHIGYNPIGSVKAYLNYANSIYDCLWLKTWSVKQML